MKSILPSELFQRLEKKFGSQGWWPVSDQPFEKAVYKKRKRLTKQQQFEICIGAILTQNTAWGNVEKAIQNLKKEKIFELETIANAKPEKIVGLIRPSGYFNQKTKKIQHFCQYVLEKHGTLKKLFNQPIPELRKELLQLHGIGKETADSIILYAAQKPVFVVDTYTKRLVERYYNQKMNYDECQAFFQQALPKKTALFNEYHALIVEHAKENCQKKPACLGCFLNKSCAYFPRQRPT